MHGINIASPLNLPWIMVFNLDKIWCQFFIVGIVTLHYFGALSFKRTIPAIVCLWSIRHSPWLLRIQNWCWIIDCLFLLIFILLYICRTMSIELFIQLVVILIIFCGGNCTFAHPIWIFEVVCSFFQVKSCISLVDVEYEYSPNCYTVAPHLQFCDFTGLVHQYNTAISLLLLEY